MLERFRFAPAAFAGIIVAMSACTSSTPLTPAATTPSNSSSGTLNATAPVPVSPVSNQQVVKAPTLIANAAIATFGTQVAFQYRFQVFDASNTLIQDSGVVATPNFTVTAALAPGTTYTWRVRAELSGSVGPWSVTASFIAPQIVGVAAGIAAQEHIVLWPGAQPPGTVGQATLGDSWNVQTVVAFPSGAVHQTPTTDELRVFDLLDRGFSPQGAIDWINSNGYFTNAAWYSSPQVVGFDYEYMALISGRWDLVFKTE